ncbi:chemotaxis-specific protein-glutamate methyltransferase CheB [Sulfurimonas aquatica]|uniref:Protein-glutamate methylesterase/protein-glutamine glutaminase n=1 Tax=Sulfurimonas aquatica TaxID=2672570 RepID=A0A975GD74_9BACT|nr:chemotaxis-specific protein-glutamate methyltransferase CheB [Sulfurimonas aquatica]QSZ42292.1 chemotaxis-specific protein-glutamate methyltransferase CheB [Sulfurimonas aquatica]
MSKNILIVDDSALVRKQLKEIISTLDFNIDFAKNGHEAVEKATSFQYDIITMDINMPIMDGLEATRQIMQKQATPILMVSSLTKEDAPTTMEALELGAIDYIAKPGTMNVGKNENREEILEKVQLLSKISIRRLKRNLLRPATRERRRLVTRKESELRKEAPVSSTKEIEKIVLIGSSTGGPGLIEQICTHVPSSYKYPICIVQHMPEHFSKAFAERLDRASPLPVYETQNGMEVVPGNIYVARGGVHLTFRKKVSGKIVIYEDKNKGSSFFQPSVNAMMHSSLKIFDAKKIVGVILTGIGDDGADAMVELKKAGAYTIGESENSATIYGMPKEAYERGGVLEQLDFLAILKKIVTLR